MSNLVPEKRVNKNGVAVIKHVRAAGDTLSKSLLPAPMLPAVAEPVAVSSRAPTAYDLRERLEARFAETTTGANDVPTFGYEMPHIDKFPDSVRRDIYDFLESASASDCHRIKSFFSRDYDNPNIFSAFVNTIDDVRWIETCRDEHAAQQSAQNLINLVSKLGLNRSKTTIGQYHFDVIKSEHIASILQLSIDDFSVHHEYYREIETIRTNLDTIIPALPVVFALAVSQEDDYMSSNSPHPKGKYRPMTGEQVVEVASYAQNHPDHTEVLIATIKERGEFNPELMDAILEGGATAVASGTL